MTKIRVCIVDDEKLFMQGMRMILEMDPEIEVVMTASSGKDFFNQLENHDSHIDVILMDLEMPEMDGVEFLHDHALPNLELHPVDEDVILHPNCSLRKLGLDGKMLSIAKQCARSASVPLNLGCCAFAGDRGLLYPELTASATEKETAEVNARDYDGYYSSNITCEIGMSEATGKDYVSIVYLKKKASAV